MSDRGVDIAMLIFTLREISAQLLTLIKSEPKKHMIKQIFGRFWKESLNLDKLISKSAGDLDRVKRLEEGTIDEDIQQHAEHLLDFVEAYRKAEERGHVGNLMNLVNGYRG